MAWGGVKGERRDLAALFLAHPTTVGDRVIASGVCERTGEGKGSCSLRSDAGDECSRQKQSHEHSRSSVQGRRSEAQEVVQVMRSASRGREGRRAADALSQSKCRLLVQVFFSIIMSAAAYSYIDFSKNRQFDEGGNFETPLLRRSIHTLKFQPLHPLRSLACIRGRERGSAPGGRGAHAFSVHAHSTHGRSATEIGGPRSLR